MSSAVQGVKLEKRYEIPNGEENIVCFIARDYEKKVGEIVVKIKEREKMLWLDGLFIEREFRNRGLGKILIDFLEEYALSKGLNAIGLGVYPLDYNYSLKDLKGWYRDRGFYEFMDNVMLKRLRENA